MLESHFVALATHACCSRLLRLLWAPPRPTRAREQRLRHQVRREAPPPSPTHCRRGANVLIRGQTPVSQLALPLSRVALIRLATMTWMDGSACQVRPTCACLPRMIGPTARRRRNRGGNPFAPKTLLGSTPVSGKVRAVLARLETARLEWETACRANRANVRRRREQNLRPGGAARARQSTRVASGPGVWLRRLLFRNTK